MGGNALKNCVTRRYDRDEYFKLEYEVWNKLVRTLKVPCTTIKAYNNKESFGDLDVLVMIDDWTDELIQELVDETFSSKEWFRNGNVLSLEYKEFQIDLIATLESEFYTSENYFAYNDLGNLLGRLAHSLGLKLGHKGLSYVWRVDTYQFAEKVISTDWEVICDLLGVSYEEYVKGFDTLEDIFKFVVASPLFHSDIYLLENRNNYSRTRDKKRKTYIEFLKYIEGFKHTNLQVINKIARASGDKAKFLWYVFDKVPGFKDTYKIVTDQWVQETEFKNRYNGDIVSKITGLETQELGKFMKWIRETHDTARMKKDMLAMNPELVSRWITYWFGQYKDKNESGGLRSDKSSW